MISLLMVLLIGFSFESNTCMAPTCNIDLKKEIYNIFKTEDNKSITTNSFVENDLDSIKEADCSLSEAQIEFIAEKILGDHPQEKQVNDLYKVLIPKISYRNKKMEATLKKIESQN